jgi:hypothetical protein
VTVKGLNQAGRFVVFVEAVHRPLDAPEPDGSEVYRYRLG